MVRFPPPPPQNRTIRFAPPPCEGWGPVSWPCLRSSVQAPTIKAVRGTVAIIGQCQTPA